MGRLVELAGPSWSDQRVKMAISGWFWLLKAFRPRVWRAERAAAITATLKERLGLRGHLAFRMRRFAIGVLLPDDHFAERMQIAAHDG